MTFFPQISPVGLSGGTPWLLFKIHLRVSLQTLQQMLSPTHPPMNNDEWMSPGSVLIKIWAHLKMELSKNKKKYIKMELSGRNCPETFYWGGKTESRDNQPRDCISPSSHAPSLTSKVVTSAHTLFSLGSKGESCSQQWPLGKSDWYDQEDGGKDHNVCSFSRKDHNVCSFSPTEACPHILLSDFISMRQAEQGGGLSSGVRCLPESDGEWGQKQPFLQAAFLTDRYSWRSYRAHRCKLCSLVQL